MAKPMMVQGPPQHPATAKRVGMMGAAPIFYGGMMGKEDMEWLEKNVGVGRIVRETKIKCPKCGQQLLGLLMITRHVCAK